MSVTGFEHFFEGKDPLPPSYEPVLEARYLSISYLGSLAVEKVSLEVAANEVTAIIGSSGCGKSTLLRCFNRMNELIPGSSIEGNVYYHGEDIYGPKVDPVEVRKRIGMVFQKANLFPKSIYDNVAFGARIHGRKKNLDDVVEKALTQAAVWDEVKDKVKKRSPYGLSGGQQQRVCIARALVVEPDVLLMDEPCSALDPIATGEIEDLIQDLVVDRSIVLVTHNMHQAARIAHRTACMVVDIDEKDNRIGHLEEFAPSYELFTNPKSPRTEAYITGRSG